MSIEACKLPYKSLNSTDFRPRYLEGARSKIFNNRTKSYNIWFRTIEAGQQSSFYSSVTLFSFLSFQFLKMMYTRFTFGEYKKKLDKNKHPHPYGVFEGPLGSSPKDEFGWMSKLRIQQTRLSSKLTDDSLHSRYPNSIQISSINKK